MEFQAIIPAPFGKLGIRCSETHLCGIEFLLQDIPAQAPQSTMAERISAELLAWLADARHEMNLPFVLKGSPHQRRVWQAMREIPAGETRTYGELAAQIGSSARAVGQACGSNPIPLVIPCHRVVGRAGLGGFMQHAEGRALHIKRWLLEHERR